MVLPPPPPNLVSKKVPARYHGCSTSLVHYFSFLCVGGEKIGLVNVALAICARLLWLASWDSTSSWCYERQRSISMYTSITIGSCMRTFNSLHSPTWLIFIAWLAGQFWNVPILISEFTGTLFDVSDARDDRYTITVQHPSCPQRRFSAILLEVDWEFKQNPCFYAGNQQGGPIYEVEEPNDSVIEGDYENYRVLGDFSSEFAFSRFNEAMCSTVWFCSQWLVLF